MKKIIAVIVAVFVCVIIGIFLYYFYFNGGGVVVKPDDKSDLIIVVSPVKDSKVSSPLSVAGRARGSWFFEGSFPIALLDQNGKTIAEGHASAQGDWMTNEFVKFVGNIQFDQPPSGQTGTIVFKKDNPSDLRQNDDSYQIPIIFK